MFARRVFELMSSNTLVISNYSRGTDEMFGDLIVYPDKQPQRLRALSDTDINELRQRALHKVLGEHTYQQRWLQILRSIGVAHAARDFTITATCSLVGQQADALEAGSRLVPTAWTAATGPRLLLAAGPSMPESRSCRVVPPVQPLRSASSAAAMQHGTPCSIATSRSKPATSLPLAPVIHRLLTGSRAALHLQYATEYPLTPANDAQQRYRTGLAGADAPLLELRGQAGLWLQQPEQRRTACFI